MKIKPGYKQTEVGIIPEDWSVVPLGILSAIDRGKFSARPRNDPKYYGGEIPFLQTGDVTRSGGVISSFTQTLNAAGVSVSRRFPSGTLFFTIAANIGDVGIAQFEAACPDSLVAISPQPPTEKRWLLYELASRKEEFEALASPGAQLNINLEKLRPYLLPVPSSAEQRAIAEALSDVDGLIVALEKLIAKKRAIKQAAMQQLLAGQTRLPGFRGKWETKRLGDILTVRHGRSQHGAAVADGKHPILASGGEIGRTDTVLYGKPSVLIGRKGTIDAPQYIDVPFWTVDTLFYTEIVEPNSTKFIFYRFCIIPWRNYNEASGVPSLNARTIENIEIILPDSTEQSAIATFLSDMDDEIEALERRRNKTRQIKQGMMQQLLTGRIRLIKPDMKADEMTVRQTGARHANVHFIRSVLAAEIIDQLHEQPTFGHVKFEKMMFLVEHLCEVETGSTYHRQAAGPYDNRALRSIDSQLRAQQWFDARKEGKRYLYVPMQKRGEHKRYFDRYFSGIGETFDRILGAFKTLDTERCEIVATLLAAWSDLLRDKGTVSDELVLHEVLNNWHEAKRRISEDCWLKALDWMRSRGFVPKGAL